MLVQGLFHAGKKNTMTLVKFKPAASGYDSLFDQVFNGFPVFERQAERMKFPATNIYESKDQFELELNVPGRSKEDFKIVVDQNLLTISFEKKTESVSDEIKTVRREFGYESFKRTFTLNDQVNVDNIQARYENGLLKIVLPKKEEKKETVKEITVS